MRAARYAVYFAPRPGSALHAFGAAWLGRDAETGAAVPQPALAGIDAADLARMTETPRRYGFHATLKAPFRLAPGAGEAALLSAVEALARGWPRFAAPPLRLGRLGRFLALMPEAEAPTLTRFAAACVAGLDAFRAEPSPSERARREEAGLTARQRALLARWGYPYVMEAFRFHFTLSGPLGPVELDRLEAALAPLAAPHCAAPLAIDSLCVFVEPETGAAFRLLGRFDLGGGGAADEHGGG